MNKGAHYRGGDQEIDVAKKETVEAYNSGDSTETVLDAFTARRDDEDNCRILDLFCSFYFARHNQECARIRALAA